MSGVTPERMRILTVKHPWAAAIIYGGKDVENRGTNLAGEWTGPVAIHAGKTYDDSTLSMVGDHPLVAFYDWNPHCGVEMTETEGHIIGVVDLEGVHDDSSDGRCSPWAEGGRFHLILRNPRPLAVPIPYRGGLGLRWLPDEVAAAVRAGETA